MSYTKHIHVVQEVFIFDQTQRCTVLQSVYSILRRSSYVYVCVSGGSLCLSFSRSVETGKVFQTTDWIRVLKCVSFSRALPTRSQGVRKVTTRAPEGNSKAFTALSPSLYFFKSFFHKACFLARFSACSLEESVRVCLICRAARICQSLGRRGALQLNSHSGRWRQRRRASRF